LYANGKNSNMYTEKQYRSQNTQNRKQDIYHNKTKIKKDNNLNAFKHNKGRMT